MFYVYIFCSDLNQYAGIKPCKYWLKHKADFSGTCKSESIFKSFPADQIAKNTGQFP